ncbi:sn-glycerol-3-phosphate transport ATP-binding protein [Bordetella pertussis]|nr:sn-glycerol-3-phosphate transport ATP-binding protein [Bordetella pertussis]
MATLSFRNVKKTYAGNVPVIHGIDMDVADGEFIVIVGPSGCGKSTLMRMVAGLETVTEGEILIDDKVVNTLEPAERDIAMVFQNYALYPHMSVFDNMAYGLKIRRLPKDEIRKRVEAAAQILELGKLLDRRPRALSGGQRQRVAMGRANRARTQGIPVRRAAVQPGRQAARGDAAGNPQAASPPETPPACTSRTTRSRP